MVSIQPSQQFWAVNWHPRSMKTISLKDMATPACGYKLPRAAAGVGQMQDGTVLLLKRGLRSSVTWSYLKLEKTVMMKGEKLEEWGLHLAR